MTANNISKGEMLQDFTLAVVLAHHAYKKDQLANLYTQHDAEGSRVAFVLDRKVRALLFQEESREHLELMKYIVVEQGISVPEEIAKALSGDGQITLTRGVL
jgi:hypothetical protein